MISANQISNALGSMNLPFQQEGNSFVHVTRGRFAPQINVIFNLEEDGSGVTIMAAYPDPIKEKRTEVCELLNLCHGQSLWNVRFHLDEGGQLFTVGKVLAWGKPFNEVQFGDIFFSLVVTLDRLWPALNKLLHENQKPTDAFEAFFSSPSGRS